MRTVQLGVTVNRSVVGAMTEFTGLAEVRRDRAAHRLIRSQGRREPFWMSPDPSRGGVGPGRLRY